MFKKIIKIFAAIVGICIILALALVVYIANITAPKVPLIGHEAGDYQVVPISTTAQVIGDNWFRKNDLGLYEMLVSGAPYALGRKNGLLSQAQINHQEVAFTDQIKAMIPNGDYLKFLRYVIRFMNKNLSDYVNEENKEEIYGVSRAASDKFDWIGGKYERLLNYHAAHDIGHALQNMMMVGCTSFASWDHHSYNGSLLIGRNFDFWVGDEFAKEKIVAFYKPQQGHPFAFITWGGFTGVVSGMNDKGLTVTINAAKSDIPYGGAATPVSLVAREILQYAANIQEAIRIAHRKKMFVSESFLVGSAQDHKAVVIEKTPDTLAVYETTTATMLCTNHYQSPLFASQRLNVEQKATSASVYRYKRLKQLIDQSGALTPQKVATILRDQRGINNTNIGAGNEKAINQLIAHHSVIFQPDSLKMWVSTAPWQLGPYVCYDLRKVFSKNGLQQDAPIDVIEQRIPADTFMTHGLSDFMKFRSEKTKWLNHQDIDTALIIQYNPNYYDAYRIAGDYAASKGWRQAAHRFYNQALQHEIATQGERESIIAKQTALQR